MDASVLDNNRHVRDLSGLLARAAWPIEQRESSDFSWKDKPAASSLEGWQAALAAQLGYRVLREIQTLGNFGSSQYVIHNQTLDANVFNVKMENRWKGSVVVSIDWDKPLQTRDGCEVTIYTAGAKVGRYPVRGEYKTGAVWRTGSWTIKGKWVASTDSEDPEDLVNVPQQHTVFVNMYAGNKRDKSMSYLFHVDRAKADAGATSGRIACIEVTFTEGEGLE